MNANTKSALLIFGLGLASLSVAPTANANGPCDNGLYACVQPYVGPCHGIMNAGVCVALDPDTGCADVAVHLPAPFTPLVPIHQCSPAWVTVEYGAECFTITVKVPPPFSQPLPIVICR